MGFFSWQTLGLGWLVIDKPPISRVIALNVQALLHARHDMHSISSGDSLKRTPMGHTLWQALQSVHFAGSRRSLTSLILLNRA